MNFVLGVALVAIGVVVGIVIMYVYYSAEIEACWRRRIALESDVETLEQRLADAKAKLWLEVENDVREQLQREWEQITADFGIVSLDGRTYSEVKAMTFELLDMERRGVNLSYRNAKDHGITRRAYEAIREAFSTLGYWSWRPGHTPEWTELGLKYLDWFNRQHGRYFQNLKKRLVEQME